MVLVAKGGGVEGEVPTGLVVEEPAEIKTNELLLREAAEEEGGLEGVEGGQGAEGEEKRTGEEE